MRVGGQTLVRVATLINSHPRLTGPLHFKVLRFYPWRDGKVCSLKKSHFYASREINGEYLSIVGAGDSLPQKRRLEVKLVDKLY